MEFLRFTSMQTQRTASWDVNPQTRPKISNTKSFSRLDTTPSPPQPRSRAGTLQGAIPELNFTATSGLPVIGDDDGKSDIFSTTDEGLVASPTSETASPIVKQPETFEELPIEIRSLTERWDCTPLHTHN